MARVRERNQWGTHGLGSVSTVGGGEGKIQCGGEKHILNTES